MNTSKELNWKELKTSYQPSDFSFETLFASHKDEGIIGQKGALEALEQGMLIQAEGYNIYIIGETTKQRDQVIKKLVEKHAKTKETPGDLCYIYNFRNPEVPSCITLKAGEGKKFQADMTEFKQCILVELPLLLESREINEKKQHIIDGFDKCKEKLLAELNEKAESMEVQVKTTGGSIGFAPLNAEGEIYTKEEFEGLSTPLKKQIEDKLQILYNCADEMTEKLTIEEKKYEGYLKDLEEEVVLDYIGSMIKALKEKYIQYDFLRRYFNDIAEDILANLDVFGSDKEEESKLKEMLPWMASNQLQKLVNRYSVNLIATHTPGSGAPVIEDSKLGELCLNGKVLLDTELNVMHTDFTHIRGGLLHIANGGYIILHMQRILENASSWVAIKQLLRTGYIYMSSAEEMGLALANDMKPEPVKAQIKIILLGSREVYKVLNENDEDFKKFFKVKVIFEDEIDNDKENISALADNVATMCENEQLPKVTVNALLRLVEYGSRMVNDTRKLPANIEQLMDLVREASLYCSEKIDAKDIEDAISRRKKFYKKLEDEIDERIMEETMLIVTSGKKVGQVNGLAVYTVEEYRFGRPSKITATTYKGKQGIVDIEKAAELSGALHTKGIHIITGFLGYEFAQERPLNLSCNICFEQNYGQIDGDSASSAELYAILSSLSDIPICQNIATTGSVNQFGEIQPIGGVNEKIEGFYKVCKKKGLEGNEGVIIPYQNKKDLMLNEEVIEAVKNQKFHIYTIKNIWEGMEVITGVSSDEIKEKVNLKLNVFSK